MELGYEFDSFSVFAASTSVPSHGDMEYSSSYLEYSWSYPYAATPLESSRIVTSASYGGGFAFSDQHDADS